MHMTDDCLIAVMFVGDNGDSFASIVTIIETQKPGSSSPTSWLKS